MLDWFVALPTPNDDCPALLTVDCEKVVPKGDGLDKVFCEVKVSGLLD